jgi:hypothetical protein
MGSRTIALSVSRAILAKARGTLQACTGSNGSIVQLRSALCVHGVCGLEQVPVPEWQQWLTLNKAWVNVRVEQLLRAANSLRAVHRRPAQDWTPGASAMDARRRQNPSAGSLKRAEIATTAANAILEAGACAREERFAEGSTALTDHDKERALVYSIAEGVQKHLRDRVVASATPSINPTAWILARARWGGEPIAARCTLLSPVAYRRPQVRGG